MEPKKKIGPKNHEEQKKWTLEKNAEKKTPKNITFLWFKLISSTKLLIIILKKDRPIRVPY